ncbi:MAG: chromosomal replication initiator protein DnaA [Paludisphaera borealis]|uniref:chromosomal replication initiator protein DnaA n=1 Tax=Paludisphaera borealis TaxID=1387353 RepID=UPI00283B2CE3|nr:chromosomal replication initiator protein DnaA [Paludisphaera borealis]MDR3623168.1 chromosomal replication initiator protein DnaA [Paludisphaera borealis]
MESEIRDALIERVGETKFGLWFGEGVRLGVSGDGGSLEVQVPNAYFRDWIKGNFARSLAESVKAVTGRSLPLNFSIQDEAPPFRDVEIVPERSEPGEPRPGNTVVVPIPGKPRPRVGSTSSASSARLPVQGFPNRLAAIAAPGSAPAAPVPGAPRSTPGPGPGTARVMRRLDDFVVGPSTQMAFAAAREMVKTAGRAFNPLVIHGGVGLGKTHLLEAITQGLRHAHPGLNIIHVTAESFTNGFLEAMRTSSLAGFRSRHRGASALVVDDVHFLAAKRATQDEFLHTFNALIERGVPIVLSSDQHPRKIAKLTDELATRFLGGMVIKLDAPDLETRRAILKSKAASRGVNVPTAVIDYIAEHVRTSVRELEGALHCVLAQASLTGKAVTMTIAHAALRETIRNTSQVVALRDVEKAVCSFFQVEGDGLKSDSRVRTLAYPRMVAMYLARKHTGVSYSEIGRFFGGRNHSTVMSAEKKVVGWLKDDAKSPLLPGFENVVDILADLESTLGK